MTQLMLWPFGPDLILLNGMTFGALVFAAMAAVYCILTAPSRHNR